MMITLQERLRAFRARNAEYLRLSHDRLAAARFVVESAGPLRGPSLDVGTGKGLLAIELARQGLDVVSIDVDDQERGLARLLANEAGVGSRITFDNGDAAKLRYANGSFGCAAMMDVLHHLAEPGPVLREMARVVEVGGTIFIADFDDQGFELVSRIHRAEGREHPRTGTTLKEAALTLQKLGLFHLHRANGWHHDVAVLRREEMGPS
jgi:2-polyprenyl-3-methyl-5-hydroxy-6-metoxy-1,4-benzoquinol methylase